MVGLFGITLVAALLSQDAQAADPCAGFEVSEAVMIQNRDQNGMRTRITTYRDLSLLSPHILLHYRQTQLELNDPIADYALLRTAEIIPGMIALTLTDGAAAVEKLSLEYSTGWPCTQHLFQLPPRRLAPTYVTGEDAWKASSEERQLIWRLNLPREDRIQLMGELETGDLTFEGEKNPIRPVEMARMFKQVMSEEFRNHGLTPQVGKFHAWSPDIDWSKDLSVLPFRIANKHMVALSMGRSRFYMFTGYEDELERYLLSRPKESVTPEEMFRISYRMHGGNVYLTLLTIENLLSEWWRQPQREDWIVNSRLRPMTNHFGKGNKFGTWYHFFGIMLYGYVEGLIDAEVVAGIESFGRQILLGFDRPQFQALYVNSQGGWMGAEIRNWVEGQKFLRHRDDPRSLEYTSYLDLNEDFMPLLEKEVGERIRMKNGACRGIDCGDSKKFRPNENSELLLAARYGDLETIREELSKGADLNQVNRFGQTALAIAAWEGKGDVIDLLLESGANLDVRDSDGWTALMASIVTRRNALASKLIDAGADCASALSLALQKGNQEIADKIKLSTRSGK